MTEAALILVVDDERPIRRALALNLRARGYEVVEADSGEAALEVVATAKPALVLLDLGLPGIDGLDVIEALRGWSTIPIIVLTVRDDERSKVAALDAGADDYVTKPFGMAELLARLRATLRRIPQHSGEDALVVTPSFRLDVANRRAHEVDGGSEVRLTPTEWAIVEHLVHHRGRLVTHRQLLTAVWGPDYDADPNLLRVHIAHIRRKLERDPTRPAHFLTDPGMGFRFEVDE
jgi:two-component system, OmpR family, KDP operon response regulator KdpE